MHGHERGYHGSGGCCALAGDDGVSWDRREFEESRSFIFDFPFPRVNTLRKVPLPLVWEVGEAGVSSTVCNLGWLHPNLRSEMFVCIR